jgi:hypothetical protein
MGKHSKKSASGSAQFVPMRNFFRDADDFILAHAMILDGLPGPSLFTAGHAIELSLKAARAKFYPNEKNKWGHDLVSFIEDLREHLGYKQGECDSIAHPTRYFSQFKFHPDNIERFRRAHSAEIKRIAQQPPMQWNEMDRQFMNDSTILLLIAGLTDSKYLYSDNSFYENGYWKSHLCSTVADFLNEIREACGYDEQNLLNRFLDTGFVNSANDQQRAFLKTVSGSGIYDRDKSEKIKTDIESRFKVREALLLEIFSGRRQNVWPMAFCSESQFILPRHPEMIWAMNEERAKFLAQQWHAMEDQFSPSALNAAVFGSP